MFRGQADACWRLVPKLARFPVIKERAQVWMKLNTQYQVCLEIQHQEANLPKEFDDYKSYLREALSNVEESILTFESMLIEGWKHVAVQFLPIQPKDDIEWRALAQHHGLATRLLDWTLSLMTAVFFALESSHDCDAAVFAVRTPHDMDPTDNLFKSLNSLREKNNCVFRIFPPSIVPRIVRQKGVFTVSRNFWVDIQHGIQTGAISDIDLVMIKIPATARSHILNNLLELGIDRSALFPDLDGLANHLNFVNSLHPFLDLHWRKHNWGHAWLQSWLDKASQKISSLPRELQVLLSWSNF